MEQEKNADYQYIFSSDIDHVCHNIVIDCLPNPT